MGETEQPALDAGLSSSAQDGAERFLEAFREIEQHLRAAVTAPDTEDFTTVLKTSLDRSPGVRRFQHDLRQFAMLRNAIVHRPHRGGQPIAEPRMDVVLQIEAIRSAMLTAPALVSVLGRGVEVTTVDATMAHATRRMLEGDYSQLPVLAEGRVVDLLTTDAVSRWMTTEIDRHGRVRLDTPVADVVGFDADRSYELVDRSADVLSALDLFARHQEDRGEMLHAIVVSKALPQGPLVAIATVTDLPVILKATEPFRWAKRS